jgi:amino acid transporter
VHAPHHSPLALLSRTGAIPISAADLDRGGDTYLSTITQVLAAIIAMLWGASMIFTGFFGIQPGTDLGNVAVVVGVILILLAVDQLRREIRQLT